MSDYYLKLPAAASPSWKAPVANAAALPASGNTSGDARVTLDTDGIYVWSGSAWILVAAPGSTSPGGLTTQVQYNNTGAFAGDAGLVYISGSQALTVGGVLSSAGAIITGDTTVSSGAFVTVPVTLTDAATIATDAGVANYGRVTLGGNRLLGNPTNPTDGQKYMWEFIQDSSGNNTITLDTQFTLGTDITNITLSTAANKRDFMGAVYNTNTSKWYVIAFVKGY